MKTPDKTYRNKTHINLKLCTFSVKTPDKTYRNKTHINLKLCTFSAKNPDKTSTVIKNIRGSLLYQRQDGKGGHSMRRSSLSINLSACQLVRIL